ncbi:MAG: ATP-binding cassette, subfamily multidrug efflux pump [Thermomicrobiales bacterium]|nr:ATP-binding cassette, subfamily multidrug efflux pump [Thermomicrobiales bacterium]
MKIIVRIFRYLRPYRQRVVIMYVALAVALGMQLLIPAVLARAIDRGIAGRDRDYLVWAAVVIVGLAALQGVFTFTRTYVSQVLAEQVAYDIRNELYAHLQRLSFSYYDTAQTGQVMARATDDITNIRAMLVMTLRALVVAIGTFLAVTVILLRIDLQLALAGLAVMPFLIVWSTRFGIVIRPLFLGVQQQFGVMTTVLQENVAGSRLVRAFAQEQIESRRFEAELEELFQRNMQASKRWAFSYPLMLLFSGVGLGATLWLGGYRVISGAMTIGTLVAFNRYLTIMAEPIRWLGFVVNRIARAIASGERIFEVLDTKPKIAERPGAIDLVPMRGEVVFENVSFGYSGARRKALTDVSFRAFPGETVGLLGPTGGGKSTIVNLIPRFYDATAGRVLIDGHDVRDLTLTSLRSQVGAVLQETFLFSVTIRENIAYGRPGASLEQVIAAAKAAKAHDFIQEMPEGYDTTVGERGVSLSGGQKQRIAIARALLLDPRILILDDATSSVDSETEHEIQEALETLMEGRTTFIIAQRLSSVRAADQICVLSDGRIVERGTHADLLALGGIYRQIYDVQTQSSGIGAATEVAG